MRGPFSDQGRMFSYLSPEKRVPKGHPLREARAMVRTVLEELHGDLAKHYSSAGRPSIPPEQLPSALLLLVLYGTRVGGMAHAVFDIFAQRLARASGRKLACGIELPIHLLPPDFGDLDTTMSFGNRTERRARFDGLQLLRTADKDQLSPCVAGKGQDALHPARPDHARLVDYKHIAGGQQLASLRPLMLKTGNRARRDR